MSTLKFMWFKEGKFLNPMKKNEIINDFIEEEVKEFYENGKLNIPQIEYCITTKCSLKCKDCNALIPKFNNCFHLETSFSEFKTNLDKLCKSVDMIRHFAFLGGEALLNKDFPDILDYACRQEKIFIIKLITNGTVIPSNEIIDVLKRNNKKAYVYISNYSVNEDTKKLLKHEKIKEIFKQNNIKFQIVDNWEWVSEEGFSEVRFDEQFTKENIKKCGRSQCIQLLNSRIDICSKASSARELKLLKLNDYIDLKSVVDLRKELINFYKKDFQTACEYCLVSGKKVKPAIQ